MRFIILFLAGVLMGGCAFKVAPRTNGVEKSQTTKRPGSLVAQNLVFRVNEDAPLAADFKFVTNLTQSPQLSPQFAIVTSPTKGNVLLAEGASGSFIYTPNLNYSGDDAFEYSVKMGEFETNARVQIAVTGINDAPQARAGATTGNEDVVQAIQLSAQDVDSDLLTYSIITNATMGVATVTNAATGAVSFVPNPNASGADSITFNVSDGTLTSNTATVAITIIPVNDAPVTTNYMMNIEEDVPTNTQFTATDVDSANLTFSIVSNGAKGTATFVNAATGLLRYVPKLNANGSDFITFRVSDGDLFSGTARFQINFNAVNDEPIAIDQSVSVLQRTPKNIVLSGTDVEQSPLTYTIVASPIKGRLSGTAPNLVYSPTLEDSGADSFTFKVRDSLGAESNVATVSISIEPVNRPPVAQNLSTQVLQRTPKAFVLAASDPDQNPISFVIISQPQKGALSGTAPNLVYSPRLNLAGADSFTFKVRDNLGAESNVATVSINITLVNAAPVALAASYSVDEDGVISIVLGAVDTDSATLTYSIIEAPVKGIATLSASNGSVVYTPNQNLNGLDILTFRVFDGAIYSNTATVSITINPVNDAPFASNQSVSVLQPTPKAFVLAASDPDQHPIKFEIVSVPQKGKLSGTAPNLVYSPTLEDSGADSFTFKVRDSLGAESNTATVSISIEPVNRPPVAQNLSTQVLQRTPKAFVLAASDPDQNPISFVIISQPQKGALSGTAPNLVYSPRLNLAGADSFTFKVRDNLGAESNVATVSISIELVNRPPVLSAQTVTVTPNTAKTITLIASDPDNQALTHIVTTAPAYGAVSGSFPNIVYTPNANNLNPDSFSLQVSDTLGARSNIAIFSITMTAPIGDAPVVPPTPGPAPAPMQALRISATQSLVRSAYADGGSGYGYAPSMIHEGNSLHVFYCSNGDAASWDVIRYSHSPDNGLTWTSPTVVLRAKGTRDRAACDPSVVKYNNTYYLFYTGNHRDNVFGRPDYCDPVANPSILTFYRYNNDTSPVNSRKTPLSACGQSSVHVAQSTSGSISGPYQPVVDLSLQASFMVVRRQLSRPASLGITLPNEMPYSYGSGQNTMVVTPNNELWMWIYDDSDLPIHQGRSYLYKMNTSGLGVASVHPTNVFDATSADVKYDPYLQKYVMVHYQCLAGDDCDNPRPAIPAAQANACLSAMHPGIPVTTSPAIPFDTRYCTQRFTRHGHHMKQSSIVRRLSSDGIIWSEPQVLVRTHSPMEWSHNIGISSDNRGHLLPGAAFIAAGGLPNNFQNCAPTTGYPCWPNWNIVGLKVMTHLPYGYADSLSDSGVISGWALDPDDSTQSIAVQVVKILGGVRTPLTTILANQARPDVNAAFSITGAHGFSYQIPAVHRSAQAAYEVRAIDYWSNNQTGQGASPELQQSPRSNPNLR